MKTEIQAKIESEYFNSEFSILTNKEKLNIVECGLLELEDEIDKLKKKFSDMERLYDILIERCENE